MKKEGSVYYFFKNILFFLPAILCTGFFFMFFYDPFKTTDFFVEIYTQKTFEVDSFFYDIYYYFSSINFENPLMYCMSIIVMVINVSWVLSVVTRHTRLGILTYKNSYRGFRDSIVPVFALVVIVLVAFEIFAVSISGIVLLLSLVLKGWVLSTVVFVMFFALMSLALGELVVLSNTVPCMLHDGYSFGLSMSVSSSLTHKKFWYLYGTWLLSILTFLTSLFVVKMLLPQNVYLIAKGVILGGFVVFIAIRIVLVFISLSHGYRNDIKEKIF